MPDFLDSLLGNADQTQALGLLGANMMQGRTAQGFAQAGGLLANAPRSRLQQQLLEAQIAETMAQADERKNKVALSQQSATNQQQFLNGARGGTGNPGGIMALAQRFGIPPEAIQADVMFNGGKNVSELLAKHGSRDMQVTNGYAYDKNNLGPGFMPFLNTSQNGQTSMGRIGNDGLPVVSAPQGAMQTYQNYRNVDEGAKADFDPVTVTPQGQNPQMTTRRALVSNPTVNGSRITPQQQAALDSDRPAILAGELKGAQGRYQAALQSGDQSGAQRAQADMAALQREMGGKVATVGMPLQSEEEKLRGSKGVEGDAKTNETRSTDVKTAQKYLSVAKQAEDVLKQGPTHSGIGSAFDSAAAMFGQSTKGGVAAQQLTALGGWLTANVPRMEGPQSNFDVGNYQRMAADVGNSTLPIERRQAALKTIQGMMENIVSSSGQPQSGGATGGWESNGQKSTLSSGGWSATLKK